MLSFRFRLDITFHRRENIQMEASDLDGEGVTLLPLSDGLALLLLWKSPFNFTLTLGYRSVMANQSLQQGFEVA